MLKTKEEYSELLDEYDKKLRESVDKMNHYVKDHPRESALIGIGIGVIITFILTLIFRRRD